jgi:hypothetical protein
MVHAAFALVFVAAPVAAWLIRRSLAWVVAAFVAGFAVSGALVSASNGWGYRWTWLSLELLLVVTLLVVLSAAWWTRPRDDRSRASLKLQFLAVGVPMLVIGAGVLISRLVTAPSSGMFTGVGFMLRRIYAEDNAKWMDFTSRLVQGDGIAQSDAMGGPLQLLLVPVADVLAAVSYAFLGGLNEVFVMVNTVIYGQFFLVILSPIVLAPIAEKTFRSSVGNRPVPAPLVWAGALVIAVASLAVSGLGHLTLQFSFLVTGLWVASFLVQASTTVRSLTSLAMVPVFFVWFPLAPISLLIVAVAVVVGIGSVIRLRSRAPWVLIVLWVFVLIVSVPELLSVTDFLIDSTSLDAAGLVSGVTGGIVAAVKVPALSLLTSQGGTESVNPLLGGLAAVAVVGAVAFVKKSEGSESAKSSWLRYGPLAALVAYGTALSVSGTWWAGDGPNYGAVKTSFLVAVVVTAVTVPLALRLLDTDSVRTGVVQWAAIGAVVFLLATDGILPRAVVYASPEQWPDAAGEDRGYWWPAEVKTQADQPISSLPIACSFRIDQTAAPSVLPDGQPMYACTRLLAGMNGADYEALPLVNWARREWYTNEPSWDQEYAGLSSLPEDLKARNFILLDYNKNVIGLEPMNSFLSRYKPPWAE